MPFKQSGCLVENNNSRAHNRDRGRSPSPITSLPSLTPSPQTAQVTRDRGLPGASISLNSTLTTCFKQLIVRCFRVGTKLSLAFVLDLRIAFVCQARELSRATIRTARLFQCSGTLPLPCRNQRTSNCAFPSRTPVTALIASVMQRSISTQTISFLRSAPRGSSMPIERQPSSAMRGRAVAPHMCPCKRSHSFSRVSIDSIANPLGTTLTQCFVRTNTRAGSCRAGNFINESVQKVWESIRLR